MNYINLYADFLKKFLKPIRQARGKPKQRLKVIADCSNGTTGIILKELFRKSKVKSKKLNVVFLNDRPDGNFPAHGPNPLAKGATAQLEKEVRKLRRWDGVPTAKRVGADLGIIFDADGDRVFFVDNLGRWVDSNEIGYILMQRFPPPYVTGIVSSWRIKNIGRSDLLNIGINARRSDLQKLIYVSRVGHYFFKKLMREKKANLGVEHSGHYYFKKFFYCDSGILAAIEVINFVSGLKTDFASWLDGLPKYYRSGEINFEVADVKFANAKDAKDFILNRIEKIYNPKAKKIIKMDGLTMEFSDWWFNVRPSNTEPLLRLNVEATDKDILKNKLHDLKKLITL